MHSPIAAQIVEMSKLVAYVATLIAAPKAALTQKNLDGAIEAMGLREVHVSWLAVNGAVDVTFTTQDPETALKRLSLFLKDTQIDYFFQQKRIVEKSYSSQIWIQQ